MRKLLAIAAALALTGCAGLVEGVASAGQKLCDHEFESRAALHLALEHASEIPNAFQREAALVSIRAALAALDACPRPIG